MPNPRINKSTNKCPTEDPNRDPQNPVCQLMHPISSVTRYCKPANNHKNLKNQNRLMLIPNGVDTDRFHPVKAEEKAELRNQLGLPGKMKLILFVGHFSREKCPDILLRTWMETIVKTFPETGIVFVGSTNPDHYEVDAELVSDIQQLAQPYINKHIFFIERTYEIEKYYQTTDIFALPSSREGMPNALLEAMSCGLPVIASKLEGVTEWIVADDANGLLFTPRSSVALGKNIARILSDKEYADSIRLEGRKTILDRFSIERVADQYLKLYSTLIESA